MSEREAEGVWRVCAPQGGSLNSECAKARGCWDAGLLWGGGTDAELFEEI